ncbi:MAG TPA: hypothetical protein VFF88_07210 [Methylocella sp.]|nr:hypothetical protein [Methylocella sp.]
MSAAANPPPESLFLRGVSPLPKEEDNMPQARLSSPAAKDARED